MRHFFLSVCLCLLFSTAWGQSAKWTVKDVIHQSRLSQAVFSPDGSRVAWIKSRPSSKADRFVSDLWLTYLDKKDKKGNYRSVQLTRGDKRSDRNPLFSADGETLYFLSSAKGGKAIWAIDMLGGEPYVVDSFKVSISSLRRLNDSTLLFSAREGKTLRDQELKKKKDNVVVVEDTAHFSANRLFAYDLGTKSRKRLTDNRYPIRGFAVSKDGNWLVTNHVRSPHFGSDGKPSPLQYLWDLKNGTSALILGDAYQDAGGFEFAEDNSGFYFSATRSSDPEWRGSGIELLYFFDLATQQAQPIDLDHDWGLGGGYSVIGTDIIVSLANGPTNIIAIYRKDGNRWRKGKVMAGEMDEHMAPIALSEDHSHALVNYSTASTPTQYRLCELTSAKRNLEVTSLAPLVKLNTHLDKKPFAKTEVIRWKGALGDEVSGILYYPHNYEEGKSYPLMVAIHGGPSGVDRDRWSDRWAYPHNLIAQRGCLILKPNYHGSSNHGQEFVESIKGHYYEYELPDILSGIDYLDKRELIKRDSMGVMGWSNGAILTTMLTVKHPDMFLAATPGAGDVNWTSDFGTCAFGVTFDQSYFGGAPWDDTDSTFFNPNYIIKSPLFEMEKVKTPTLIFHGSEDRAVPRDQGWEYYRALQQVGQAPVRFLWFPGQPHGLGKLTHQTRKVEEELRWFDTYFFGTHKPKNEAKKKGSPLAKLMARTHISKPNGLYGVMANKALLPQMDTVKADSIAISIFEITHGQFQQYQPNHSFPLDQYNHPITDISWDQVNGYLNWLREQTGDTYRLPNKEEAAALHEIARKQAGKENTLAYWAGYSLTVDEVEMFRELLSEANPTLLLAVGTFGETKVGKATLYDLGGNAAEMGQEGNYGFSAYDFFDEADALTPNPSRKGIGFRVVQELK